MKVKIGKNGVVGVYVEKGTAYVYHKCCSCGCKHKVNFEWPSGGVIMKWKIIEGGKNKSLNKILVTSADTFKTS